MTSETDLSTADLAQPRGPERSETGARTGERAYETTGNRAADPAEQETVEMPGVVPSTGSTRDDARPAAADPGRGSADVEDRGMAGQEADPGMADRGMADRGMADGGMADRGMADRGEAGQQTDDRDMTGRDMSDRDTSGRDVSGRDMSGRDTAGTGGDVALLDPQDAEQMRRRWSDTQARFVDDPREAVQTADALVAELMQTLARSFSEHKGELEAHWRSGGDPDTEQLRQALQRYRSFFDRLLSA